MRSHERFPTGEPDRLESVPFDADTGDSRDLFVAEDLVPRQPVHSLFGHAVRAPEVAAIGDGDPQILHAARERIDQRHGHRTPAHATSLRSIIGSMALGLDVSALTLEIGLGAIVANETTAQTANVRSAASTSRDGVGGGSDPSAAPTVGSACVSVASRGRVRSGSPPAQRPTSADGSKPPQGCKVAPSPRVIARCHAVAASRWLRLRPPRRFRDVNVVPRRVTVWEGARVYRSSLGGPAYVSRSTSTGSPAATPSPSGSTANAFAAAMPDNTLLAWNPARSHT